MHRDNLEVLGSGAIRDHDIWMKTRWGWDGATLWFQDRSGSWQRAGMDAKSRPRGVMRLLDSDDARIETLSGPGGLELAELAGYPFADWALECLGSGTELGYGAWVVRVAVDFGRFLRES